MNWVSKKNSQYGFEKKNDGLKQIDLYTTHLHANQWKIDTLTGLPSAVVSSNVSFILNERSPLLKAILYFHLQVSPSLNISMYVVAVEPALRNI